MSTKEKKKMNQARVSDIIIGTCLCHMFPIPMIGFIGTGSYNTILNYPVLDDPSGSWQRGAARFSDICIGMCGHLSTIVTGNTTHFVNNLPTARIMDMSQGCILGTITSGSENVLSCAGS